MKFKNYEFILKKYLIKYLILKKLFITYMILPIFLLLKAISFP